jgi:hypothetical protein
MHIHAVTSAGTAPAVALTSIWFTRAAIDATHLLFKILDFRFEIVGENNYEASCITTIIVRCVTHLYVLNAIWHSLSSSMFAQTCTGVEVCDAT